MSRTLVLLWLGSAAARAEHDADLDSWARARVVTLRAPVVAPRTASAHDDVVAERLEDLLTEAHTAIAARDAPSAKAHLDQAERILRANPELVESAWLMAELLRTRAELFALDPERNPIEPGELLRRADELEGPRAESLRTSDDDAIAAAPPLAPAQTRVPIVGPRATDEVYVDAVIQRSPHFVPTGEHHVRVVRSGATAWAGWVDVLPHTQETRLPVPAPAPCTREDFGGVAVRNGKLELSSDVACPRWAVARPVGDGIEVAQCRESRCGKLRKWTSSRGTTTPGSEEPPASDSGRGGFQIWLAWTAAVVATVAATGVAAWQLGAFDEPERRGTRFTFTSP